MIFAGQKTENLNCSKSLMNCVNPSWFVSCKEKKMELLSFGKKNISRDVIHQITISCCLEKTVIFAIMHIKRMDT